MLRSSMSRVVVVAAMASVAVIATSAEPAAAAAADYPAGIACTFPLRVDRVDKFKVHEFTDANGNMVLLITGRAGLTLTNTETGASLTLSEAGGFKLVPTSDGQTTTFTASGHLLLIMV
jgi:hypothetical protein